MQILAFSDQIAEQLYNTNAKERFGDVDLAISCGDLPYYYVEFVISCLNKPSYFVRGNHSSEYEYHENGVHTNPLGSIDLHRRVVRHNDLLIAGVEGSLRYRPGPFQYTQQEMWSHVFHLVPTLMLNHLRYGRYLDVFVTHAPPWKIHDQDDLAHQGIKAFLWLDRVFQPAYHLHGHVHLYRQDAVRVTRLNHTRVVNAFNFQVLPFPPP